MCCATNSGPLFPDRVLFSDAIRTPCAGRISRSSARTVSISCRKTAGPNWGPTWLSKIVSPSDTARQIDRKVHQYLAAGTLAVWVEIAVREIFE